MNWENQKTPEQILFEERQDFINKNYPFKESEYNQQDIINNSLDGLDVIEKKDKNNEIEGLITFYIANDHENIKYMSIGVILVREDLQNERIAMNLLKKLLGVALNNNCEYITAIADTQAGNDFLRKNGFDYETDPINSREHLRYELMESIFN